MLLLLWTVEDLLDSVGAPLLVIFLRRTLRPLRAVRIDIILCFSRTLAFVCSSSDRCLYVGLKLSVRRSVLLVAVLDDVVCDLPFRSPFVGLITVI